MTPAELKRRRAALGMTQAELAAAISTPAYRVRQQEISRWESGAVAITAMRAAWLDVQFGRLEAPPPPSDASTSWQQPPPRPGAGGPLGTPTTSGVTD